MSRPVLVDVSAHGSARLRNCPPASMILLKMAKSSKVERAGRSMRVTVAASGNENHCSIPLRGIYWVRGIYWAMRRGGMSEDFHNEVVCPFFSQGTN